MKKSELKNILKRMLAFLPDKSYIKLYYFLRFRKKCRLNNPQTFNEKLQWLKLYYRKTALIDMVDKYAVRAHVAEHADEACLIPLLGGPWRSFDEINFDQLPNQFVLKCTHDSGSVVICKDKAAFDQTHARNVLESAMARDYALVGREWQYRYIPRGIICEEYITDEGQELIDYKIHCFNGEPKMILVCADRFKESGLTEDFFSEKWEHLPVKRPGIPNSPKTIPEPKLLKEMLALAKKLSAGLPFVRVDLYVSESRIFFGELTFYPSGGMTPFVPNEWDMIFGNWLKLPDKTNELTGK